MAQQLGFLHISSDPVVTAYLGKVGERLARHLPPVGFPLRYLVVESSWPDAFTLPGGRIYVTRGLIVQLRNPDELAAVLRHEMGHVVTHQSAIETTFLLEKVLGVTRVTDRGDIQKKKDEMDADWRHNRAAFRQVAQHREQKQLLADQVALYAIAASGYAPEVYPDFFRRITLTGRSTGNWLSDLFHATTSDQLRLRALLKTEQSLPKACIDQRPQADAAGFQRWRKTVLDFNGWGKRKAELHDVVARVKLQHLSVGTVQAIGFSPDGKFLLAQKNRNIYIFTRNPFTFAFRIYAPGAFRPRFSPDSRSVAFVGTGSRVQVWDLASQKRVLAYTPRLSSECSMSVLSPDARELACIGGDGTLELVQVPSGKLLLDRQGFGIRVSHIREVSFLPRGDLGFSPDGRYFLAISHNKLVELDLSSSQPIALAPKFESRLAAGFVFLSDGRLLAFPSFRVVSVSPPPPSYIPEPGGVSVGKPGMLLPVSVQMGKTAPEIFKFPSGKSVRKLSKGIGGQAVPATGGDYLLLGPISGRYLAIVDLSTGKIKVSLDHPAADVYKGVYAHQLVGGGLGLYNLETKRLRSRVSFPQGGGAYLRAMVSPDLKWLATPQGAIWNLASGKMVKHMRPFNGGWFDGGKAFYADFPSFRTTPRTLVRIDLINGNIAVERAIKNSEGFLWGSYWVAATPHQTKPLKELFSPCRWAHRYFDPMDCDVTYEIRDARSGRELWSRRFPKETPRFRLETGRGRVVIDWPASAPAVEDEIKKFPQLEKKWETARKQPGEDFVEVLGLPNGSVHHALFANGGTRNDFLATGKRLVSLHHDYIEIYLLDTGTREGEIPGRSGSVLQSGSLLAISGEADNQIDIYSLRSHHRLDQFTFPSDVDFGQFSPDGKRLLVLTSTETAYILDMTALQKTPSTNPCFPAGGTVLPERYSSRNARLVGSKGQLRFTNHAWQNGREWWRIKSNCLSHISNNT